MCPLESLTEHASAYGSLFVCMRIFAVMGVLDKFVYYWNRMWTKVKTTYSKNILLKCFDEVDYKVMANTIQAQLHLKIMKRLKTCLVPNKTVTFISIHSFTNNHALIHGMSNVG